MAQIHPTALIDPRAQLDDSVQVGPYAVIGPEVRIGAGTRVGPHTVIEGKTTIGRDNVIYQFASIGAMPQDMSHGGEVTELVIGDRNTIREFTTLQVGTVQDKARTTIGSDNWIMAYVHLAHDVIVGDHCVLANNATLAGHVHVGDWATIGGLTGVHQFVHVGAHAMIGFQGHVAQDVAPYMTVDGNPLGVRAVNLTGLRRRGFSNDRIGVIRQLHKLLFRDGTTLEQSVANIEALKQGQDAESIRDIQAMLDFLAGAKRGLVR